MSASSGLIYEVTLTVEREAVESFDVWLATHVEEMLTLPGFIRAQVFTLDDDAEGRPRRITHFHLESEEHLEQYFADQAAAMRQAATDRFGDQFSVSREVLRQTDIAHGQVQSIESCLNCQAALHGQYCGNCGQRARSRLISLWELISDAFGDLFEIDSRIWGTLRPLLLRPGKLTHEYLQGRRTRFMPPFRTYIVLSIIFFLVLLFDPREEFGLLFEPGNETNEETVEDRQTAVETEAKTDPGAADDYQDETLWDGLGVTITTDDPEAASEADDGNCEFDSPEDLDLPEWLARRMTPERLLIVCEKVSADDGKALLAKMQDNIPAALFFLLPLMALVLKLLYPLSKRYYVEHLLFVVHFHAFFFLMLILQMLFSRAGILFSLPESMVNIVLFATSLYIPVYLYKAMRKVYDQGNLASASKFVGLVVAYSAGTLTIFAITGLMAAFSI